MNNSNNLANKSKGYLMTLIIWQFVKMGLIVGLGIAIAVGSAMFALIPLALLVIAPFLGSPTQMSAAQKRFDILYRW